MLTLPEWACKEENYKASKDNDYFITKSLLGIIRILRQLKFQSKAKIQFFSSVGPSILTSIIIILCACSHKSAYLLCISALLFIILSFLDGKSIFRLLKHTVTITFLSSLLLLPAIYFYQNSFIILIPVKTFLIILSISLLTTYCNWHSILGVMNKFHVPSIIVFIFDTTLRYIVLLGETAQQILYALKIRSIGKNNNKSKAFGGVMGIVFQKSRKMSEEMYQAMCCRCFTGSYANLYRQKLSYIDFILVLLGILYCWLFFVIERVGV